MTAVIGTFIPHEPVVRVTGYERVLIATLFDDGWHPLDVADEMGRATETVRRIGRQEGANVSLWRERREEEARQLGAVLRERVVLGEIRELARRAGVSRRTVHRAMRGLTSIETTERIALAAGLPV